MYPVCACLQVQKWMAELMYQQATSISRRALTQVRRFPQGLERGGRGRAVLGRQR